MKRANTIVLKRKYKCSYMMQAEIAVFCACGNEAKWVITIKSLSFLCDLYRVFVFF